MPSPTKGPRLGSGPSHERLMLANLATSLFEHGRITTTVTKAKRVRPLAERLITFAKRGDLHARRRVMTVVRDKDVVHRLFAEIGPHFAERPGGYTRITKLGPRKGDNAPMAVIELVGEAMTAEQAVVDEAERARGTTFEERSAPTGATREAAEELADESETAAAVVAEAEAAEAEAADADEAVDTDEATDDAVETDEVEESESDEDHPYGDQSRATEEDGFPVKAVEDGKVFYVSDSEGYAAAEADVWFASSEAAEEAGFTAAEVVESADDDGAPEA